MRLKYLRWSSFRHLGSGGALTTSSSRRRHCSPPVVPSTVKNHRRNADLMSRLREVARVRVVQDIDWAARWKQLIEDRATLASGHADSHYWDRRARSFAR